MSSPPPLLHANLTGTNSDQYPLPLPTLLFGSFLDWTPQQGSALLQVGKEHSSEGCSPQGGWKRGAESWGGSGEGKNEESQE